LLDNFLFKRQFKLIDE